MPDTLAIPQDRAIPILAAARSAFAEKGFDGASMQDLARAAGMSAGNFYRYFPSKNAIVEAMIAHDLMGVEADFQRIIQSDRPLDALREALAWRLDNPACLAEGPLWAEIHAAAARRPQIARIVGRMEEAVLGYLLTVFARIAGLPPAEAEERFSGHAAFLVFLFKGTMQQASAETCQLAPKMRSDLRELILSTMKQTLDDVARAATHPTD
ncbi:MAG: TetR/AcrR family transcriptional regulator [Proteobacteria bacterium]|nr:TetR/AcrR family transcriptional regulator [Pseudomonadota bacterium]MBS0573681.1 TetR/AcrR family transcriptional regulator [Pseudomonadota bacterium]